MRFFKIRKNGFNWKYVFGEILLIFIGISLAIWFNNWNSSNKADQEKKIAITKIIEEIENNINELDLANSKNQFILDAFNNYQKKYNGNTSELIATPEELDILLKKYPDFFKVKDSVNHINGQFIYKGSTRIELELPTLTEIAWETTRTISITNEFNYECLYDLESMYHLQRKVQSEVDKASGALQKGELKDLMNILGFLDQLGLQLKTRYENTLNNIENCS